MSANLDGFININGDSVQSLELIYLLTMLTLLPTAVVMMTSFTRYVVSLSFLRTALGTQQTPPNIILVGMALFLTLYTMSPIINEVSEQALNPYTEGTLSQEQFFEVAQVPFKRFMLRNMEGSSLRMYCEMGQYPVPGDLEEGVQTLPLRVVVPAFVTSELKKAFEIGLYLYIPFLLVDVVVSTTLMSMGMVMLPPSMISTPFKLLLFITMNGWEMLFSTLVKGYS